MTDQQISIDFTVIRGWDKSTAGRNFSVFRFISAGTFPPPSLYNSLHCNSAQYPPPPPPLPMQVQVDQSAALAPLVTTLHTELSLQQPRPSWQGSGTQDTPSSPAHLPSSWLTVRPRVQVPPTHDHWLHASPLPPSWPARETPWVCFIEIEIFLLWSLREKVVRRKQNRI